MNTPQYSGNPSASATPAKTGLLSSLSLLTPPQPNYAGDPGTGAGGQGTTANLVKAITFAVLSPQLSPAPAALPPAGSAVVAAQDAQSTAKHHSKGGAVTDATTVTPAPTPAATAPAGPGPVAKSQPLVIAVPDGAKSYKISVGSLAYPSASQAGIVPPIPSAMPVGLDGPPQGQLQATDAQIQITVSWALLPGAAGAIAGDYKTLITVDFYDQ
jgi:hypothetical protein